MIDEELERELLIRILPFYSWAILVLITLLCCYCWHRIRVRLKSASKATWTILLSILLLGILIRIFISPWNHLLYWDEWESMESGRALLIESRFMLCTYGNLADCKSTALPPHAIGLPMLLSFSYFFFGVSHFTAKLIGLLFGSLSVFMVFLLAYILIKNEKVALWSSFLFSLIPVHVLYSTSVSTEVAAIFFMLLSFICFLTFAQLEDKIMLYIGILSFIYSLQFRAEFYIVGMLLLVILFFFSRMKMLLQPRMLLLAIGALVIIIPHILYTTVTARWAHYISGSFVLSLENVAKNFYYLEFWFNNLQSSLFSILAIIGMVFLLRKFKKALFLLLWFISFLVIYLLYWFAQEDRFMIFLFPVIAILGGNCLFWLAKLFKVPYSIIGKRLNVTSVLFIIIILIAFINTIDVIKANSPPHNQYEKEERFLQNLKGSELIKNSNIVTATPYIINFDLNEKAISCSMPQIIDYYLEKGENVLFYENVFCSIPPSRSCCQFIIKRYELKEIAKESNFYSLAFHKIIKRRE